MKHKTKPSVFVCGVIGNLLYLWGLYQWSLSADTDVAFLFNTVVMVVAVGFLIFHAESNAVLLNRKRTWGLCGLLGPVGWGLLSWSNRSAAEKIVMVSVKAAPAAISKVGRVVTAVIVFCWLSALVGLLTDGYEGDEEIANQAIENERNGYLNIRKIVDAQVSYRKTDWNGDGRHTFAQFLPHLWKTVDGRAVSVKTGLLPKAVSFAQNERHAINGYYYSNTLKCDQKSPTVPAPSLSSVGYDDACFTVFAIPSVCGETGMLAFLTNQTGRVFALVVNNKNIPSEILNADASTGWVEVSRISDINKLQQRIHK